MAKKPKSHIGYHQFLNEDGEPYGSFEVAYLPADEDDEESREAGYYWASCWPGCLPDSDWMGPFDTPEEAYEHAMNW